MSKTRAAVPALALASLLALSACSGGSESPASTPPSAKPTSASAPNPSATDTPTSAPATTPSGTSSSAAPSGSTSAGASSSGDAASEDADLGKVSFKTSAVDAVKIATDALGSGTLHGLQLDYSRAHTAWVYEVKVIEGKTEHKASIDAATGKVLQKKQEPAEADDAAEPAVDPAKPLAVDDALKAATALKQGRISEWELTNEKGKPTYKVSVTEGNDDVDVLVDAATGKAVLDS